MKYRFFLLGAAAAIMATGVAVYATADASTEYKAPARATATHHIPGTLGLDGWNYVKCSSGGTEVGYVVEGAMADVDFTCDETGVYEFSWTWSYATGDDDALIEITDLTTGNKELTQTWHILDGASTVKLNGLITAGPKNIKFTFIHNSTKNQYTGNYTAPVFTKIADEYVETEAPAGWDVIPGVLDITHWAYYNGLRLENNNTNVGYAENGGYCTNQFYCTEQGVYQLNIDFYWFQNPGDFIVTITDQATGKKEVETSYHFEGKHDAEILLKGLITKGRKDIRFDLVRDGGGFLVNWKVPEFVKVGEKFASMEDFTVADGSILPTQLDGYDYAYNIPMDYAGAKVTFTPGVIGADAVVTAGGVEVTDNGDGTYSIPVPAMNAETVVNVALEADEDAYIDKDTYSIRFFRIGGEILSGLTVDEFALDAEAIATLNDGEALALNDYIFTAVPEVNATFMDGSTVAAEVSVEGTVATYTFKGVAGDKEKSYTMTVDGLHLFTPEADDKTGTLRYEPSYRQDDGNWSDGKFTFGPCNDGWGGRQFKVSGHQFTLTCPADMKIKQLTFASLLDNYTPGKVTAVTSEGATIWLPSASSFVNGSSYDLVINVENHVAGTPFVIEIEGGGQPAMWFDFVYETVELNVAPELQRTAITDLTGKNHAVVSFTFNTEIEPAEVEFNGGVAASHVTGTTISFPLWDLEYETEYTLTLPAGSIKDLYGNLTDKDYSCTFTTGKENDMASIDADRFIAVETVEELRAAVESLSATNSSADAPTTIIYLHNGDYDLGDQGHLDVNNVYNVSFIGQSQEGVLIHGSRTGISNPILSTRYSTNIYMENFTVRNDLDFGAEDRAGVGVAHYGGNLDIMKNVTLQSIQDTQVTGERGYYYNCTIHGGVDYICGGGDHYYDRCTLIQETGGYITAPATSAAQKHGYVFVDCTIQGPGSYTLGRPWQGEPRCCFINTVMETLPDPEGWKGMSDGLTTHFYEYNSKDAAGNLIDLSTRKVPSGSANQYTPVLTAEEAAYFTHRNVLGYSDSWDAQATVAECDAPTLKLTSTGLEWNEIKGAAGYIVYVDNKAAKFTTETTHAFTAPAAVMAANAASHEYKVAAVNANGAHGILSSAASDDTTGIESITAAAEADAVFYNLNGQRVENPSAGIYIMRRGTETTKVIIR